MQYLKMSESNKVKKPTVHGSTAFESKKENKIKVKRCLSKAAIREMIGNLCCCLVLWSKA